MDVLITSEPEKIPTDILELQDANRPLPSGARFFEEKFTFGGVMKSLLIGLALDSSASS